MSTPGMSVHCIDFDMPMMKILHKILLLVALALPLGAGLPACHSLDSFDNDYYGNFDALWTTLDRHYCFFDEKGVDWDAVGAEYRAKIKPDMELKEFFDLCADMLAELRDGHTNLSSWFAVSYYRDWWSAYPQNFNWRLIQQSYLGFDYTTSGAMSYKLLQDSNVAYVRYSSFAAGVGHAFVNDMMLSMKEADGMIIDIRDNGGGDMTAVEDLVSHFIDSRILAGYISHKDGPGHDDFSEPYPYYYDPALGVLWLKPVIILTNRSTFSAANNFVQVMKPLPQVAVVGDTTGGGSGMPFSSEMPIGWAVRFSASPVYDADMNLTENGIEPSPGGKIDMDPKAALDGHDTILDFAIDAIVRHAEENKKATTVPLTLP